jgi:hypothetical protein
MSEHRKPREFWVVDMSQGDEISFKAFKYPVNGNKIHCREVMPAEISDTEIFEAMKRLCKCDYDGKCVNCPNGIFRNKIEREIEEMRRR